MQRTSNLEAADKRFMTVTSMEIRTFGPKPPNRRDYATRSRVEI